MDKAKETNRGYADLGRQRALEADEGVPGEGHQVSTGTEAGKCQVEVEGKTRAAWLGQELVGSTRNSAREAGASSGALGVRNQVAPS